METIKPSGYNLFAKPADKETKTKSGFIINESSAERPLKATVLEVGSKVTEFKKGDVIVYKIYTTTDYKIGDDTYILIAEEDVLGTVIPQ